MASKRQKIDTSKSTRKAQTAAPAQSSARPTRNAPAASGGAGATPSTSRPPNGSGTPLASIAGLEQFTPDPRNANKGTERGRGLLEDSMRAYGAGRSILVDRHGVIIGGNKTHEVAADVGLAEAILVPTDGTRLVVVQRTDLDLAADPRAVELAVADNRAAEVSLAWDGAVMADLVADGADFSKMFSTKELEKLVGQALPGGGPSATLVDSYQVLVTCKGESDQGTLLERLMAEGYSCRALIA